MPAVAPGTVIVEKTPGYFYQYDVPERMKMMDPDIKIILAVRDPVDRLDKDQTSIDYIYF